MELCSQEQCTGCLACYNSCNHDAILLLNNEEGFLYPQIQHDYCVECGLCKKSCPVLTPVNYERASDMKVWAAWNKNYDVVRKSTSGGFFTTIAEWFFQKGGCVYGAAFDDGLKVNHIRITSNKELYKLVGSKYVQSNIGESYKNVKCDLNNDLWVLFSGTPCQIAGLHNFLGSKFNNSKLITIDLACHGVPSPLMFKEYVKYLETRFKSKIKLYSFRDKKWSWNHYNTKAVFDNGKTYYGKWEEDIFMRGFLRDYFLRPSCYQCLYASAHRPGDFSIADFWGYLNLPREEQNRDRGVNAILVNTQKAEDVFKEIQNDLYFYQKPLSDLTSNNRAFRECSSVLSSRYKFWEDYRLKGYINIIDDYFYPEPISKGLRRLYKYGRNVHRVISGLYKLYKKMKKQ